MSQLQMSIISEDSKSICGDMDNAGIRIVNHIQLFSADYKVIYGQSDNHFLYKKRSQMKVTTNISWSTPDGVKILQPRL